MKKYFLIILSFFAVNLAHAGESNGRFFLEGDGKLALRSDKSGILVSGHYRNADGSYNRAYLDQINRLFGMPAELKEDISLRTIAFVDYLQDKYAPGKTLRLLSGYRSPKFNASLRQKGRLAARTSYHIQGMAADLIFPGVDSKAMWEYARQLMYGGVGYYDGKSVHIDSGKPRFWTSVSALPKVDEPPQNKNIYLSVDYDRYKPGDTMRLFFSGVSEYPFGVSSEWVLKKKDHSVQKVTPILADSKKVTPNGCYPMDSRLDSRFLSWQIPTDVRKGESFTLEVPFCDPVTPQMPEKLISRPFEIN